MTATPTGKLRGPYAKSSTQRDLIIRTALEHFAQHGYHGASMREIARAVGLSQAGLLHHFPKKADLLTAVLDSRDTVSLVAAQTAVVRAQDPLAGMIAVIEENSSNRQLVQMFTVLSAEATDESHPAHEYFRQRSQLIIGLMRTGIEHAVKQGLIRPDLDLDQAARQCQALMYGLQVQWLFDPSTDMAAHFQGLLDGFATP
ncbi:TetR/AcrR family transcriptional regulator [Aquihabitans sp. McL0605]|uniref:TetR/AcrR family transcriptional regulator n=1 Tax=Aquihabitans sp. McL0605 TaxID=3415671 RepID=UPI003CE780F2